jgi:hypothetical protein
VAKGLFVAAQAPLVPLLGLAQLALVYLEDVRAVDVCQRVLVAITLPCNACFFHILKRALDR